jgi:hypothetical protein
MAKRSRKYGRQITRNNRSAAPARDYQASDNDITLVQPERSPTPVPVAENWDHEVAETVRGLPTLPGGYFDFVQQIAGTTSTATSTKPFLLTRPSPPPPEQKPPEPKVSAAPPPPPPPEPRPREQRTTDLPPAFAAAPVDVIHAPLRPPVAASALMTRNMPSTIPPPVSVETRNESVPPPKGRAWASMFTIGPLSALVAALVSSLVWSFHTSDLKAVAEAEKAQAAEPSQAVAPCTTRPGSDGEGTSSSTRVTSSLDSALEAPAGVTPLVSIDALPTMGSGGTTRASLVSSPPAESSGDTSPRARASRARAVPARASEPVDTTRTESARSEEAAPPPSPALSKGPDRGAVSRAMARATSAASACDSGPHDGRVSLTITPAGTVTSVSLVKGFGDADVNACVLRAFGRAKIPAYDGEPVQVRKAVRW